MRPLISLYRRIAEASGLDLSMDRGVRDGLAALGLIDDSDAVEVLGHGARGAVFNGASGRVIKVTMDAGEAAVAKRIRGKRHPGVVTVFSVSPVSSRMGRLHALELEALTPLSERDQQACLSAFNSAGYHSSVPISDRLVAEVSHSEPRAAALAKSCLALGLVPDLWGDGNVMASASGVWTLADLGPAPDTR